MTALITKDSVCWPSVEYTALSRIDELRADLETAPGEMVAGLQAEIRALRWLLRQADPPAPTPITSLES